MSNSLLYKTNFLMHMYFHVVEILSIIYMFVPCLFLNGLIKVKAFKELLMNILYNFMISQTIDTAQDYFFNIFIIYKVFFYSLQRTTA